MDIGKWLDYFELISTLGIVNSALLVIFTSERLTYFSGDLAETWPQLVITVFIIENILIAFRNLLAAIIPDNPDWIEREMFASENRVKQVQDEIAEKSIIEAIGGDDIELVEKILGDLHHDRDLASLHVQKLLKGANRFIQMYDEIKFDQTQPLSWENPDKKTKLPYSKYELKKKLKTISTILDNEDDNEEILNENDQSNN